MLNDDVVINGKEKILKAARKKLHESHARYSLDKSMCGEYYDG